MERAQDTKLAEITSPEFQKFGIRFINSGEYRIMMEQGHPWERSEMYCPCYDSEQFPKGTSLNDYVAHAQNEGWHWLMQSQTMMRFWDNDYRAGKIMQQELKRAYDERGKGKRDGVLRQFSKGIQRYLPKKTDTYEPMRLIEHAQLKLDYSSLSRSTRRQIEKLVRTQEHPVYEMRSKDSADIEAISNFVEKQELPEAETKKTVFESTMYYSQEIARLLLRKPTSLNRHQFRAVMRRIMYYPKDRFGAERLSERRPDSEEQYHIALVFGQEAIRPAYNNHPSMSHKWRTYGTTERSMAENTVLQTGVKAALALMPDRDLKREMISLQEDAGLLAHPILDSKGKVITLK